MSPFYLVLYVFIALIVLLCVVSFIMYLCHICSGVCGYCCGDREAASFRDVSVNERQPLHDLESNYVAADVDDPGCVTNVKAITRKYEQNIPKPRECNRDIKPMPSTPAVTDIEASSFGKVKFNAPAPPIPPKPAVPVLMHSQPSSKKSSISDFPAYPMVVLSNPTTPIKTYSTPKRKPPPPPPTLSFDDDITDFPPPPRSPTPIADFPPHPPPHYAININTVPTTDNYLSDCD